MANHAAVLAALEVASDVTALNSALANAKAQGFSNRHDAFKDAKRRLFALNAGMVPDSLPPKTKRVRPPPMMPGTTVSAPGGSATKSSTEPAPKKRKKDGKANLPAIQDNDEEAEEERGGDPDSAQVAHREHQIRVAGFSPALKEDRLNEFFGECGAIAEAVLVKNKEGRSRRIAFISFKTQTGADAALGLHEADCFGFSLRVTRAEAPQKKTIKGKDKQRDDEDRVFIGGLPYTTTEKQVRKLLKPSGSIRDFFMPLNKKESTCKGFAIVKFDTTEGMTAAMELNGTEFQGATLIVETKKVDGKDGGQDGKEFEFEVFVGGLYGIAKKKIKKHFADCGEIESFTMPLTAAGESKGIAFVAFKTEDAIEKAIVLNGSYIGERYLTVERKRAKEKPQEWTCPSCGDLQFAKNDICRMCGGPRPGKTGGATQPSATTSGGDAKPEIEPVVEPVVARQKKGTTWIQGAKVEFQDSDDEG